jgi:DNA transposition AAA+ family ATPase
MTDKYAEFQARLVNNQEAILQKVRALMAKRKISQSLAAKEMDVSPTTLTQLLNGSYGADPSKQLEKLARWSMLQEEQAALNAIPAAPEFVPTATSDKIMAALVYAQMARNISVIYGGAGLGKTVTTREYQRNYANVWIGTMSPAKSSVAAALEELCFAVGLRTPPQGAAKQQREIERRLNDTSGLVIIDEAQHLTVPALDAIRAIHDTTRIGFALVGNEAVFTRMTGGNRAPYLDRLYSRIGKKVKLARPTASDITRIAEAFSVTEKAELELLKEIGARSGALRSVVYILQLAVMKSEGKTPGLDSIKEARLELGA